jgi:hypothetical protein
MLDEFFMLISVLGVIGAFVLLGIIMFILEGRKVCFLNKILALIFRDEILSKKQFYFIMLTVTTPTRFIIFTTTRK